LAGAKIGRIANTTFVVDRWLRVLKKIAFGAIFFAYAEYTPI